MSIVFQKPMDFELSNVSKSLVKGESITVTYHGFKSPTYGGFVAR